MIQCSTLAYRLKLVPYNKAKMALHFQKKSLTLEEEHAGEYYVQNQMQYSTYKATGIVDHNCLLDIDSEPHMIRTSGIICTIGECYCYRILL